MASVRMKTDSAGPAGNRSAGQVYPVSPDEGAALVGGGFAAWVEPPVLRETRTVETATVQPPENAAVRTKPKRR